MSTYYARYPNTQPIGYRWLELLKGIEDINYQLKTVDIDELMKIGGGKCFSNIKLYVNEKNINWDEILENWFKYTNNINFIDHIIFDLFSPRYEIPITCSLSMKHQWLNKSIQLAIGSENLSLVETLIYALGQDVILNSELHALMLKLSTVDQKIYAAMRINPYCNDVGMASLSHTPHSTG